MAVSYTQKQTTWTNNFVSQVQTLMALADSLQILVNQFTNNAYGTGGAEAIPDAVVQVPVPAATAANLNSTEGAVVTILATITSNRGYLELLRQ